MGGAVGPYIVGNISQAAGDKLQTGVLAGIGFPLGLVIPFVFSIILAIKHNVQFRS